MLLGLVLPWTSPAAEEKKEEQKKPEPPRVAVVLPLGVTPGVTNKIKIRGQNLTNVTELRFVNTNLHAEAAIKSKAKADVPKEMDAKKVGDTQLEVELKLPADAPRGTNAFVVVSPDGGSEPHSLLVLEPGSLVSEKEPNNGFRQAQEISFGKTIQGVINEAKEVDVFRITGQAGQTIVAEVSAARFGSMLDSILTLYDERGHVLATNDDSGNGADSLLRVKLPAGGIYFLSLIDAHDRGGVTFVYQLAVTVEK